MSYELPFILYKNVLEDGTVTVTSEASGFPKENMFDWLDWTYWKASTAVDQNIDIDKGAAGISVDTLAILAHNLGTAGDSVGTVVTVYEDDNSGFSSPTTLGTVAISNDRPFYLSLTSGTERYNRIKIANLDEAVFAGVVWLGAKMTIPVGPEFAFDPDKQNIMSEKFVSYSGRMVSSAVKYSQRDMIINFRRIAQSFISSDLLPFLEDHYGQMKPFFFVPDPGDVFGTDKIYYIVAPDDPTIELPIYNDDIGYRNWILRARGVRQSTFR
jgi:hypothetical protein